MGSWLSLLIFHCKACYTRLYVIYATISNAEQNFYSIDVIPGMCGSIKEGLYTSSNWIIYLERDPHHPWIFGLTGNLLLPFAFFSYTSLGVEDNRKKVNKIVFFKRVCRVLDTAIKFDCNDVHYEIYSVDGNVYIWNPSSFGSQCQLFFRYASLVY